MQRTAVRIENLGKRYRLGQLEPYRTLRDTLAEVAKTAFRARKSAPPSTPRLGGSERRGYVWALKNVSLAIEEGETLGVVGPNGAGKTTLLKVLSRITEPTEGRAEIRGRVGSLLEVGTGFHPELSGRENIYLNGAILGMRRREIEEKTDSIIDFAELRDFMETPIKRYSTGMQVRLAFAVAAHLEPQILLVDEVLAVGDAAFQKKSLDKMEDVAGQGRTVLFVSHNMGLIRGLCQRAIWLDRGRVRMDGDSGEVVTTYLNEVSRGFEQKRANPGDEVILRKVVLRNGQGRATLDFRPGEDLTVEIHYHARRRIHSPYFWIAVTGKNGPLFSASMLSDGKRPKAIEGDGLLKCTFKSIPLKPQQYSVRFGARAKDGVAFLRGSRDVAFFNVIGRAKELGVEGEFADAIFWQSPPILVPYEWTLPDGTTQEVKVGGVRAE